MCERETGEKRGKKEREGKKERKKAKGNAIVVPRSQMTSPRGGMKTITETGGTSEGIETPTRNPS